MSAPVCYVERIGRGSLIRRVRVVGDKLDASWTPPAPLVAGQGASEEADPTSVVEQTRAAARWVAQQLPRSRVLSAVCLDADGAACVWLSTPSTDPAVVAAALASGRDSHGESDGGSSGTLAQLIAAGAGMERSVQALAEPRASRKTGDGGRRRMAVLSVPDLTVRVFLDELDAQGVAVNAVSTLWHALAASWDPAGRRAGEGDAQCTAVVLLDPESADSDSPTAPGRLVWAWSAGGELLAGGSMRLRTLSGPRPATETDDELAAGAAARRLPAPTAEGDRVLVCGRDDAGRLAADWLAWSAQLGVGPSRIICVGPVPQPENGEGFAELLSNSWHGASIDAAVHPDPVGATLDRFRGREDDEIAASDPREAMLELSGRPGRIHRWMYRWSALAIAALAAVVGIAGWRMSAAVAGLRKTAETARAQLTEDLAKLEPELPQISASGDPVGYLMGRIVQLRTARPPLEYERPTLAELARLIEALSIEGLDPELKIEELSISNVGGSARFTVPSSDLMSGELIRSHLAKTPGELVWRAETSSPSAGQTNRTWSLNGTWVERGRGR